MIDQLGGTSSEAVAKATGKNWDEWVTLLDKAGMKTKEHAGVVKWLEDKQQVESGWWAQNITVAYEIHHGKRVLGETKESSFQVGVQKNLDIGAEDAWKFLISQKGLKIWLGDIDDFTPFAGYDYRTKEGISGEVRTIDKGKKLRLTWKLPEWRNNSTLQIYLLPAGGKTSIRFHQEKLADAAQRTVMAEHWQSVLDKLAKLSA